MKKMMLSIFFIVTFCAPLLAQSPPISQTIKQLRQIKTDSFAPLPATAPPLLTQLKHQLLSVISATIQSPENQSKTPAQLQTLTLKKLRQLGVKIGYSPEDNPDIYTYGDINEVTVKYPAGNVNILTATTTIGVCCGEDTSLYVFKRNHSRWQLALTQEANGYKEVSGAQGRFRYAVSRLDSNQNFFVVTARVNPWCTSNWQGLYYKVLRPGAQPDSPRILLSHKESIYLGTDPDYRLKLIGNTFTLRFETEATERQIYNGVTTRPLKLKYEIKGNQVKRLVAGSRK